MCKNLEALKKSRVALHFTRHWEIGTVNELNFSSPYGGLIIIRGAGKWYYSPRPNNTIRFTLQNVVEAPHFRLQDPDNVADWDRR